MDPISTDDLSLRGLVLAAQPELLDPNFQQALIFLADHSDDGAFGLVLNRPTGKCLGDLMTEPQASDPVCRIPVCLGGPVQREKVLLAAFEKGGAGEEVQCRFDIGLEDVEEFLSCPDHWVRAFLGFSGWSEGQLEGELAENTWKLCEPSVALFDDRFAPNLWDMFTSSDQRWRHLLSHLPKDPSRN